MMLNPIKDPFLGFISRNTFSEVYFWVALFAFHINIVALSEATSSSSIFHKHDKSAYLSHRGGAHSLDLEQYSNRPRRGRSHTNQYITTERTFDDPYGCTLYAAQSSIPNSGLGVYTTLQHTNNDLIGLPEIGIPLYDMNYHQKDLYTNALLPSYPWGSPQIVQSNFDANQVDSLIPSLGMLANSHLGLKSCKIDEGTGANLVTSSWKEGEQSKAYADNGVGGGGRWEANDVGRGASSDYYNINFRVTDQKGLQMLSSTGAIPENEFGTEIFVDYGRDWFSARESNVLGGALIPFEHHYPRADYLMRKFLRENPFPEFFTSDENQQEYVAKYNDFLRTLRDEDPKLAVVLPRTIHEIPALQEVGGSTARFSVPNSLRPKTWFETHGFCMDNLRMGRSTIPQAGNGAFAARFLRKGEVVAATPLITIHKDLMVMWEHIYNRVAGRNGKSESNGVEEKNVWGYQMLLNYCFGHTNSSLLLFPYTSTVHFINHGETLPDKTQRNVNATLANVELRWSNSEYHHGEFLEESIESICSKNKPGLMIDFVASRDIYLGEEVLLDYGADWASSWNHHIATWSDCNDQKTNDGADALFSPSTIQQLNDDQLSIIRTEKEQILSPYPSHVRTACYYEPLHESTRAETHSTSWEFTITSASHPCKVIERSSYQVSPASSVIPKETAEGKAIHIYTVEISIQGKNHIVKNVPRYAIFFAEKEYHNNHNMQCAFRHSIGLSENMMPDHWLDR